MKSERRHELRENDLAHTLTVTRDFFEQYSKQITLGALAVLAVFVITTFVLRSRATARQDVWREKNALSFDAPGSGGSSVDRLLSMAQESSDRAFILDSLMEAGRQSLRLAKEAPFPPDRDLNNKARQAFEELLKRFPRETLAVGVALSGLATVEENEFLWDYNPAHKERAREYLNRLANDPMFQGLPLQRVALDRLKTIDSVFQVTHFMPPPPPSPPAEDDKEVEGVDEPAAIAPAENP